MRPSLIVLAAVVVVGGIIIALGFQTNDETAVPQAPDAYQQLEKYKTELEKVNQYNKDILEDLQTQIENSDNENLEQLREEIDVLKRVIDENKKELEDVIQRLTEMQTGP